MFGGNDTTNGSTQVLDLTERQARTRFAPLNQIEGYWTALRGNRPMPLRSEIDPRGLKGALEYCFVLERIAPGLARMRVAGSHLGDLMGMEVRGMPISSFLDADSRQAFGEMLEEVFETPATATVTLVSEQGFGRPVMTARMILMPVKSDLGDTSRILGGFVTDGDIGRSPRRFKVQRIKISPIVAKEMPAPSTPTNLPVDEFRKTDFAKPRTDTPAASAKDRRFDRPTRSVPVIAAEDEARFDTPIAHAPWLRVVK